MFKPQSLPPPELFVPSCNLVRPASASFYVKLHQTLQSFSSSSHFGEAEGTMFGKGLGVVALVGSQWWCFGCS
jgi:hypothetical protein